ncbi:MAG TPA: putative toxin-antitoxin system toxin component, PIN family [Gammaproteobacteria bacterium]|nr:putative toxin-antitoxin system toxin component, PIN family [Gammaproteobacteria bacterium]
MRLVFDTNVLIAAFISHGQCSDILEHCARRHVLVSSEFVLMEFEAKLLEKFHIEPTDVHAARVLLASRMEIVQPAALAEPVCRDPDDDWILATALEGRCDCIITGDKDLLTLNAYGRVRILGPGEFWQYELTNDS